LSLHHSSLHSIIEDFFALPCRWHDAGTYDLKTKTGGANGSIRYEEEYTHGSNAGLKIAIDLLGMHRLYSIIF
jgi:catalase (peroxidase I)